MSGSRTRMRSVLGAAILVSGCVPAITAAMYWLLLYHPLELELDRQRAERDSVTALESATRPALDSLREEVLRYREELTLMGPLISARVEVPILIGKISDAARHAGIELGEIQPRGVMSDDEFEVFQYGIAVRGSYHRVGAFLAEIGSWEPIVIPIGLQLRRAPATAYPAMKSPVNEVSLIAESTIQLLVAKDDRPPPSRAPGAGIERRVYAYGLQGRRDPFLSRVPY